MTSMLILLCDVSPVTKLTSRQPQTTLNRDLIDRSFEAKKQSLKGAVAITWHQRAVRHMSFITGRKYLLSLSQLRTHEETYALVITQYMQEHTEDSAVRKSRRALFPATPASRWWEICRKCLMVISCPVWERKESWRMHKAERRSFKDSCCHLFAALSFLLQFISYQIAFKSHFHFSQLFSDIRSPFLCGQV